MRYVDFKEARTYVEDLNVSRLWN